MMPRVLYPTNYSSCINAVSRVCLFAVQVSSCLALPSTLFFLPTGKLQLANNRLTGTIPTFLGTMTSLCEFVFGNAIVVRVCVSPLL